MPDRLISFLVLESGTPVISSDGVQVGTVRRVLHVAEKDIFDGIVIETKGGDRFVDAPEIDQIFATRVTLLIDSAEADQLPEPSAGAPMFGPNTGIGRIGRLFGLGPWKRRG